MGTDLRQVFFTVDTVKLLVERDKTGAELVNLLPNPDGDLGGWGWVTPVTNTAMARQAGTTPAVLEFSNSATQAVVMTSPALYVSAGVYLAARWKVQTSSSTGFHRARLDFFNAAGSLLGSSTQTGYLANGTAATRSISATITPATTAYARLRFDLFNNTSGADAVAGQYVRFNDAVVTQAATSGALSAIATATAPVAYYTDVITSAQQITVNREGIDVGTLTARIASNALDPSTTTTLRPGRRVILQALANGVWEPLFTGKTSNARVSYAIGADGPLAVTQLTAVDAVPSLAATKTPYLAQFPQFLRQALEAATTPVPWDLDGQTGQQAGTGLTVGLDPAATLLDAIIRVRDSAKGMAWVSRRGVVSVYSGTLLSSTVADTWTEDDYAEDVEIGYDTSQAINKITVQDWVSSTQTTYGPYIDRVSVRQWGELSATYTTVGATPAAFAASILATNKDPVLTINATSVAMTTQTDLDRYATREIGDRITLTCLAPALTVDARIRGISHVLTANANGRDSWFTTYQYDVNGRAPIPTA